jgi:hypothetical protein
MDCAACDSDLRSKLENVELCNDPNTCECYITLTPDMIGPMCEECRELFKEYIDHRGMADEMILNNMTSKKSKEDVNNTKNESHEDEDEDEDEETYSVSTDQDFSEVNIADIEHLESSSFEEVLRPRNSIPNGPPRGIKEFIDICIEWCDVNPRLLKEMRSINVSYYIEKGLLEKYDCRYCRKVGKKYNGHPWGQCPNYHRAAITPKLFSSKLDFVPYKNSYYPQMPRDAYGLKKF